MASTARQWSRGDPEPPPDVIVVRGQFAWGSGEERERYLIRGLAAGWTWSSPEVPPRRFINGAPWDDQTRTAVGPLVEVRADALR